MDDAIEYVAGHLPDGYEIQVLLENGYAGVKLIYPSGHSHEPENQLASLRDQIVSLVDWAVAFEEAGELIDE